MTIRKTDIHKEKLEVIGRLVKQHRRIMGDLSCRTRWGFIRSSYDIGLPVGWISERSLANIENGLNMPSIITLYNIARACQIEPEQLFLEVARILDEPIGYETVSMDRDLE